MIRRPPRSTRKESSAASDVYKRQALDGGNDGLDLIKKVIYKAKYILKVKGMLSLEIGNEHFKKVSKILIKKNFKIEHIINDYQDNIRCIISRYIGNQYD